MEHIDSVQTIQNLYHVASTAPANTMPGSLGGLLDRHLNMARVSLGDVQNEQKQVSENICFWLGKVQLEVLNPGERATYSVQSFFRAGRCLRARRAPLRRWSCSFFWAESGEASCSWLEDFFPLFFSLGENCVWIKTIVILQWHHLPTPNPTRAIYFGVLERCICGRTDCTGSGGPAEFWGRLKERGLGWPPKGSEEKSGALGS